MYWPAFEFSYTLDLPRLKSHLIAVEACQRAALGRVLPPHWRELQDGPLPQSGPETEGAGNKNPFKTQRWVTQRFACGSPPLSLQDILTMHHMVAEETKVDYKNPGALRIEPVQVGREDVGGVHLGAPVPQLPLLMEQYIGFLNDRNSLSLHPVIQALLAHFFFVTIHPFVDGNGRVSRLVATAILLQRGYNVHGGFYALSDYFYQYGFKYYSLLHRCWNQGPPFDLTEFVALGMEGVVMELRSMNSFIKMKLDRSTDDEAML